MAQGPEYKASIPNIRPISMGHTPSVASERTLPNTPERATNQGTPEPTASRYQGASLPAIPAQQLEFRALGIRVASKSQIFHDDGYVTNIDQHSRDVAMKYLRDPAKVDALLSTLDLNPQSRHLQFIRNDGITIHHTFYKQHPQPDVNIWRRGHEETHALHAAGELRLLDQALREHGIPIDLKAAYDHEKSSHDDRELVAEVGAIFALYKAGGDIEAFAAAQRNQTRRNLAQPFIRAQQQQR